MNDLVSSLRARARVLHRRAQQGEPSALEVLRVVPELGASPLPEAVLRRHALTALAIRLGFAGWKHAVDVLSGASVEDAGTLLYPKSFGGSMANVWSASYEEARAIRAEHGGFLLPYKRQYFVTEEAFIDALGLDPTSEDWARIDRDWARPRDRAAWSRLMTTVIASRLGPA